MHDSLPQSLEITVLPASTTKNALSAQPALSLMRNRDRLGKNARDEWAVSSELSSLFLNREIPQGWDRSTCSLGST